MTFKAAGICLSLVLAGAGALLGGSREYPFVYENACADRMNIVVQEKRNGQVHTYTVSVAGKQAHSANAGFKPGTPNNYIWRLKIDGVPEKWYYTNEMTTSEGKPIGKFVNDPWQFVVYPLPGKDSYKIETYTPAKGRQLGLTNK